MQRSSKRLRAASAACICATLAMEGANSDYSSARATKERPRARKPVSSSKASCYRIWQKLALEGSLSLERLFVCSSCGVPVHSAHIRIWREKGASAVPCPCGNAVPILEPEDQIRREREAVRQLESDSDRGSKQAVSGFVVGRKEESGEYDVFLSYNSADRKEVAAIAERLRQEFKIRPWLDQSSLVPGELWLPRIEEVIRTVRVAAIFFGVPGIGRFQQQERLALMNRAAGGEIKLIPVILKGVEGEPEMPETMKNFHRVDFRAPGTGPIHSLVLGITGTRPES